MIYSASQVRIVTGDMLGEPDDICGWGGLHIVLKFSKMGLALPEIGGSRILVEEVSRGVS